MTAESPTEQTQSTIEILLELADKAPEKGLSIGEIVDGLSDRGFGIVQLILSLPVCIPFLYGIPQAVAVPMIFVALQIVAGRHTLWLPEKARARRISKEGLTQLATKSEKYVGWFERIAKPSLVALTSGPAERIFGVFMVIFCASILIPLPMTNTVPGIGIGIMSIGFLERDGRLVLLGTIIGGTWVTFLALAGSGLISYVTSLISG